MSDPGEIEHAPGAGQEPDPEQERADRERVGRHVRRMLPEEMQRRGIGWHVEVGWGARLVWATLTRGDLEIRTRERGARWWEPARAERGDWLVNALANALQQWYIPYRAVDPTGRMRVPLWRTPAGELLWEADDGAERVTALLAPGVRRGQAMGGNEPLLHRLEEPRGLGIEEALEKGWLSLER